MEAHLSSTMQQAVRAIDGGERNPSAPRRTLRALWSRGLIAFQEYPAKRGWILTAEGRLAVSHGRQMLSARTPE